MPIKPRGLLLTMATIIGSGMLLSTAHWLLDARIAERQRVRTEKIYFDLLSLRADDAELIARVIDEPRKSHNDETRDSSASPRSIYIARSNHRIVGLVLPMVAHGYNGPIDLLVALNHEGAIVNVRAIAHRESRGIGDAIDSDKTDWMEHFAGLSNSERVRLRADGGDIDQLTGATVTARAVTNAVREALVYFNTHRAPLLNETTHE